MKTASIRELKNNMTTVLGWVEQGVTVEIQRRGQAVAVLSKPKSRKKVKMPDFMARLKADYGDRVLKPSWAEVISEERGNT